MENPTWVTKLFDLIEEAKSERDKSKFRKDDLRPIPKEKIVLSSKEDGLLWFEMLKTLGTIKSSNGIISFPNYFEIICPKFSIKKAKAWNCMFFLAEFGLIEIIRTKGIKLNYEIYNATNDN